MIDYNFTFKAAYTGIWGCIDSDTQIPGTLHLDEHDIKLELFSQKNIDEIWRSRNDIRGIAYSDKKNYHFILKGVHLTSHAIGLICHYKFEIEEIILAKEEISSLDNIKNICIRTKLADNWLSNQLMNSFDIKREVGIPFKTVIKFEQQNNIILFDNDDIRVFISNVYHSENTRTLVQLESTAIINIDFKKDTTTFEECDNIANIITHFFSIIWNETFEPDYIMYTTVKGEFIRKKNDRFSYIYLEPQKPSSTYTSFENFKDWKTISEMIRKWIKIYEKYSYALSTYFEVISNTRNAPNIILRCFISILETLANEFKIPQKPLPPDNNKKIFMNQICDKYNIIDEDRLSIEQKFLMEKKNYIKSTIYELVCSIQDIIPQNIDKNFINKAINTRHNLTHISVQDPNSFMQSEIKKVNLDLSRIIRAYLLRKIGAPEEVIKIIIKYHW